MLQSLIDRLGEPGTLLLAGLVIGTAFGFLAQRSRFCLRSAVIDQRPSAALDQTMPGSAARA